jgi:hypothetical protein
MEEIFHSAIGSTETISANGSHVYDESDGEIDVPTDSTSPTCEPSGSPCDMSGPRVVGALSLTNNGTLSISEVDVALDPGEYDRVEVKGGTLTLNANGEYVIGTLLLNRAANVELANEPKTAQIFITDHAELQSGVDINCDSNNNEYPPEKLVIMTNGDLTFNYQTCSSGFFYATGKITLSGNLDVYGALSANEYSFNWDSRIYSRTERVPYVDWGNVICQSNACPGKDTPADSWHLVGIPADLSGNNVTVDEIFGDDLDSSKFIGDPSDRWRLYQRSYNSGDNESSYALLTTSSTLTTGIGYWLGTKDDGHWDVSGTSPVNWGSCPSGVNADGCLTIDLKSTSSSDPANGGPYRYNMLGYMGLKPAKWADFRFVVDGGTPMTPDAIGSSG